MATATARPYDPDVKMHVRIPRKDARGEQESQLAYIVKQISKIIKEHQGRGSAKAFRENVQTYFDLGVEYEETRKHIEYMVNLYIQTEVREIARVISTA